MPTVLRERGYDFKINTDDHSPAHVHVWYQGALVIIEFESIVIEREAYGNITAAQRRGVLRIVRQNQERLVEHWDAIHG